jgi:hypothetical protein
MSEVQKKEVWAVGKRTFDTKNEAEAYSQMLDRVTRAKKVLRYPKDPGCKFANGEGYIQLTEEELALFNDIYRAAIRDFKPDLLPQFNANPKGIIGRYLDDSDSPLYSLWGIACQIDAKRRLWGQPYYANHPAAVGEYQGK